jgi:hypothetical protein
MASRIEDYALIGDCETAALVARDGSMDWLCLPRFDAPACFAALLGTPEHGRWRIAPRAGEIRAIRRRYRSGTLVLETEYETEAGAATLIDCMLIGAGTPTVVRIVEGKRGRVAMRLDLVAIRPGISRATAGPPSTDTRAEPVSASGRLPAEPKRWRHVAGARPLERGALLSPDLEAAQMQL